MKRPLLTSLVVLIFTQVGPAALWRQPAVTRSAAVTPRPKRRPL